MSYGAYRQDRYEERKIGGSRNEEEELRQARASLMLLKQKQANSKNNSRGPSPSGPSN